MSKGMIKRGEVRRVLADTAARLAALEGAAHSERLAVERQLRSAGAKLEGTRDMTETVSSLKAEAALEIRIEVELRGPDAPMSLVELTRKVGAPAARVQRVMKRLRETPCATRSDQADQAMKVFNHGTDEDPRWAWVIGDQVDAQTLYGAIERMLRRRPYTFAELSAATGARRGRISGATVEFARSDLPIWTVGGSQRRYVWFIGAISQLPSELRRHARPVRLAPDKNKV